MTDKLAFSGKTLESTLRPCALHSEPYWVFFETRATNSSNLESKSFHVALCRADEHRVGSQMSEDSGQQFATTTPSFGGSAIGY
jgi:hypothetical protein